MKGHFGGLITAMVTPFDADGRVELGAAQKIDAWLLDNGSEGLVVTGTTGEGPTLTDQEKAGLWRAVVEAVGDRGSVIAGSGTNDTAHSIHLTREAEKAGCDAALVVTPYYNRPPQSGLLAHFQAVAGATGLPILLYDIPSRTGRKIDHATLLTLAETPNIAGVSSQSPMSPSRSPARCSSRETANTGPIPISSGSQPATVNPRKMPSGWRPRCSASFASITTQAEAPSESWLALPAVMQNPSPRTGFNTARPSAVESGRAPSSPAAPSHARRGGGDPRGAEVGRVGVS